VSGGGGNEGDVVRGDVVRGENVVLVGTNVGENVSVITVGVNVS